MESLETQPEQPEETPAQISHFDVDLDNRFDYHKPDSEKAKQHEEVRAAAKAFAFVLVDNIPNSRERSLALTNIEEAMFWANAAIARNNG